MDALQQSQLKTVGRREKLKTIIPAIEQAASRAKDSYQWMRPPRPPIILT